jgi:pimeloyl-ACP methyl ester carboxylesterase
MRHFLLVTAVLFVALALRSLQAQSPDPANLPVGPVNPAHDPLSKTLRKIAGEQLWSDQFVHGRWRIQRNELTGVYRLLDPAEATQAWGTAPSCRFVFANLKQAKMLPPLDGRAVITLHGLGRSGENMVGIGEFLEKEGGFTWINVTYASNRKPLEDHAASLASVIAGLEGIDEIHFVCHSLGNLVVRRYLGEASQPNPKWKVDPRVKRMVMLGPPNNGAHIAELVADVLKDNEIARLIAGPSAWQIAREWDKTQKTLGTPAFEFGIISGGASNTDGLNPLLNGDDDLVLGVEETRLPGAADFRVVGIRHGFLIYDPTVRNYVFSFLKNGYFTTATERQPIPNPQAAPPAGGGEGQ